MAINSDRMNTDRYIFIGTREHCTDKNILILKVSIMRPEIDAI